MMDAQTGPANGRLGDRRLLRMLWINGLAGGLIGVGFVIGAVLLDVGRLGSLLRVSDDAPMALALLIMGSIVTFASVAMGGAIMLIPRERGGGGGRRMRAGLAADAEAGRLLVSERAVRRRSRIDRNGRID